MGKSLSTATFGVPSADVLAAIDSSDKCADLQAAGFRFQTKLADLERQFEAKASESGPAEKGSEAAKKKAKSKKSLFSRLFP